MVIENLASMRGVCFKGSFVCESQMGAFGLYNDVHNHRSFLGVQPESLAAVHHSGCPCFKYRRKLDDLEDEKGRLPR
jgi:hypothetical protein